MKIGIQSFNYAPHDLGGSERSARDLAIGLAARGHDIRVVLSDGSKPYPDTQDGIPLDVVQGLPIGKSPLHGARNFSTRMAWNLRSEVDPVLFARVVRWLRNHCPDVVLMNNPAGHGTAMLAACRLTGTPVLPVIRDYGWFCAHGVMMRGDSPCTRLCGRCVVFSSARRRLLKPLPRVVAISEYVAGLYRDVLGTDNTEVIYNAVPERFLNTPRPTPRPADAPLNFGYLGRLHPTKGVGELVEAWQVSGVAMQGHRLLLGGDNVGVTLPKNAADLGIDVLGRQDAISFLDRLDALFLPALWAEPFGRTVIEALARGLFVIGSPNGGIPELVPEDCGLIPERIDVASLTVVLQELVADPARVRRTRETDPVPALERFRNARLIDAYENILLKTAGFAQ